jgi:glycosyltransferase involved in cell wall biosynthesis
VTDLTTSVVICAFADERWDALVAAVASVQRQTAPAREVIVVADHNEALLERARRELRDVTVVANDNARGLSGARNTGVALASGDVVAFLDDDAAAAPDWLEHLAAAYADESVLGVGGAIEARWLEGRPRSFPAEFEWVVGCTYAGMPTTASPVRNLIGANMSLRRDVLARAGGFRSDMGRIGRRPLGCEETELCIRAARLIPGGVFLYEPRARVAHLVPASRTTWRYFRSRCYSEGLSKARVAALSGRADGLSSERAYATRTLPSGVARGLADARRGDVAGLARASAIAFGLAMTAAGYCAGATRGALSWT